MMRKLSSMVFRWWLPSSFLRRHLGIILFPLHQYDPGNGKALPSLILTICRQGLIFIPLIFVLNAMFGLDGVIYAQPAADYLSIVVAILICAHLFRTMDHREEKAEG